MNETNLGYTNAGLKRVGELLRKSRGDTSLRPFYDKTGISVAQIRRLEEGLIQNPTSDTVMRIAAATRHTIEEIEAILRESEFAIASRTLTQPEFVKLGLNQLTDDEIWQTIEDFQNYLRHKQ